MEEYKNIPLQIEVREPLLTFLKTSANALNADACIFYEGVNNMHPEEKKREFRRRFKEEKKITDAYSIKATEINKYEILKFIGVGEKSNDDFKYWNLEFSSRPDKFVVIKDFTDPKPIPGEGLTAYSARTKQLGYYDRAAIKKSILRFHDQDDTSRKVHPECRECLVLPIELNGKYIVIRFDIYEKSNKKGFSKKYIETLINEKKLTIKSTLKKDTLFYSHITNNVATVLSQSDKQAEGKTYGDIFKGENIINSLTQDWFVEKIESVGHDKKNNQLNKKYYEKLLHLYFVLNRRTYLGEEKILRRIVVFADELWKINYNTPFSFGDMLERFKDQETIMLYGSSRYRDHFMHQMHVFVLGYIIINLIGFDFFRTKLNYVINKLCSRPEDRITYIDGTKHKINYDKKKKPKNPYEVTNDTILRIWFLISFFHDLSYALERLDEAVSTFVGKMFDEQIDFKLGNFDWDQLIFKSNEVKKFLQEMCIYFLPPEKCRRGSTTKTQLLTLYLKNLVENQDHGVFSALYLLTNIRKIKPEHDNFNSIEKFERYIAAIAISLHNQLYEDILINNSKDIQFKHFPMESLLILCDSIQEWGRVKKYKHHNDEIVDFGKCKFEGIDYTENKNTTVININIKFDDNLSESLWDTIYSFYKKQLLSLKFGKYKFKITYIFLNDKRIITFH